MARRFFVTATDTGVGKTEVACALLAELRARGARPFAFKPYEAGDAGVPDSERLRRAGGGWQALDTVSLHRFAAPLAPGIAARLEGRTPDWRRTLAAFRHLGLGPGVVEGAGGLFVPLDERHDVVSLIVALELPVVVVARAGLGTINHSTLTLRELARRRVRCAALVLVQGTPGEDPSVPHNRAELQRRFRSLTVVGPVPFIADANARSRALRAAVRVLI